jgi:uncharacterized protein (DUF934 family)
VHIKNREILSDTWRIIRESEGTPEGGFVLLPYSEWLDAVAEAKLSPKNIGAWLETSFDFSELIRLPDVLAVYFDHFTDGRGYSLAKIIRGRMEFKGDLFAIGDITRDQLLDLEKCGFNGFILRDDQDIHDSLEAFEEFNFSYRDSFVPKGGELETGRSRKLGSASGH